MRSARFTAVAATSTITSPGPHTGSGTSPQPSTSGPPGSATVTARMALTLRPPPERRPEPGTGFLYSIADAPARRARESGAQTWRRCTDRRAGPRGPRSDRCVGPSRGTRRPGGSEEIRHDRRAAAHLEPAPARPVLGGRPGHRAGHRHPRAAARSRADRRRRGAALGRRPGTQRRRLPVLRVRQLLHRRVTPSPPPASTCPAVRTGCRSPRRWATPGSR